MSGIDPARSARSACRSRRRTKAGIASQVSARTTGLRCPGLTLTCWMVAPVSPIEEALVAISDGRCLSPSSRSILSFSASALRSCTDVGHAAARVLELWKGNTPEPGPTGVRRNGKTGKIVWERVAMFVEHVDIIRAVGWREDGRLLASCDLGGTVKLWARVDPPHSMCSVRC